MEYNGKTNDVFISYSHVNKDIADKIANYLEFKGIKCWYAPRDIRIGDRWETAIMKAIKTSHVFVLIFTKDSNGSPQVQNELTSAFNAGCVLIPFIIEKCTMMYNIEYYLSSVHWLDAVDPPMENRIAELFKQVSNVLGRPQAVKAEKKREDIKIDDTVEIKRQINDVPQEILDEAKNIYLFSTKKTTDANDRLKVADKIKALLKKYDSKEIALRYTMALLNATAKMTNSDDILETADKIKSLLDRYNTPEIAYEYAKSIYNAAVIMPDISDRLEIAKMLKLLLIEHDTPEIALQYTQLLVNETFKTNSLDDIFENAESVRSLLEKYDTPNIAMQYGKALVNLTKNMTNPGEILAITEKIALLIDKYDIPENADQYAIALVNATSHMTNKDDILKTAEKLKSLLDRYNKRLSKNDTLLNKTAAENIAKQYAQLLANATLKNNR